jgi:hypothetical protein
MRLLLFMMTISTIVFGSNKLRKLPFDYTVVSDELDEEIVKGSFVLAGTTNMFSSNNPLDNVLVGCVSSGKWSRSDSTGKFSIVLNSSDSVIYIYKEGWSEIVINDYDFKDQHRVEIDVWLTQSRKNNVKRKPVIYLYSETKIQADVFLDPKGEFTFTYPTYSNGWSVTVNPENGIEVNHQAYPYLFWEAKSEGMSYMIRDNKMPGFIVESSQVISFFEEKLQLLGFNQEEMTDFITYWGPLLSHKEYAFIQFLVDENYNNLIADLTITPAPDNERRVFIYCSGIDSPSLGIDVVEQELIGFERNGFVVLEWGGSILDLEKLAP